ncbi:DUF3152 domain-containing protein [Streptomyces enissocaesilis]|uniref:DUF3152 domain-containing protein n=1 Tax=Streptomyces enissocaesilis TaxID=332589 RepID=A0ABN3XFD4_9ACTN
MGRHSRRGPAPRGAAENPAISGTGEEAAAGRGAGSGRRRRGEEAGYDAPPAPGYRQGPPLPPQPQQQQSQQRQQYGGTPARGVPHVRGGHPERRESGGGWSAAQGGGRYGDLQGAPRAPQGSHEAQGSHETQGAQGPQGSQGPRSDSTGPQPQVRFAAGARIPGPRQDFLQAFDAPPRIPSAPRAPSDSTPTATGPDRTEAGREAAADAPAAAGGRPDGRDGHDGHDGGFGETGEADEAEETGDAPARGGRGRTFTGIAAAAVTTVLAVVVAGQVAQGEKESAAAPAAGGRSTKASDASRSDARPTPSREADAAPATYEQQMARTYPIDPRLTGGGDFEAIGGFDKAPGKGQKFSYRVDVEKGLGLDGALFARAVQETLNDDRSWAHDGAMTFERISSGRPDFVITLASPGTTGVWCAKSGLDTLSGNVSCDSAATERVMINAYRWAQGAKTFGKGKMFEYRQMLINHEIGHRLGHGHKNCETPGELAPIMQQQTKSLRIGGITCKPNAWVYPGN